MTAAVRLPERVPRAGHPRWIDALDPDIDEARLHAFVDRDRQGRIRVLKYRIADGHLRSEIAATRVELLDLPGYRLRIQPHVRFRAIREDLPIVLMSGYDEQRSVDRLHGAKADVFLKKPFRSQELVSSIHRCLNGER